MKLYIHPGSPNSRRARLAARLAGVDLEEIIVDVPGGANRTREYLALNPMGKVPTLVTDDGRVVLESYAIGVALCTGTDLLPPERLPEILRWMFFDACHFAPPLGTLTFQNMFAPQPDADAVARACKEWKRYAAVVETTLADRRYLLDDDRPTLADVALTATLTYAEPASFPLDGLDNLVRWRATMEELPAARQTLPSRP